MTDLKYRVLLADEIAAVEQTMLPQDERMPPPVRQALASLIGRGGKRLRPALVLLGAHIFEADLARVIPVAAAIEMLHTATLIHDDLIDGALTRRGVITLNAIWSPAATVLAGDLAFAWAAELAARGRSLDLVSRFSQVLGVICGGELQQMFVDKGRIPSRAEYEARIFAKTASLFGLAAETGPRMAEASPDDVAHWHEFGRLLGLAFQVADDILDFIADEVTLGKPVGSDLRQRLVTLPVLYFLELYPQDGRVQQVLDGRLDEGALDTLIADIRASRAPLLARQEAERYLEQALGHLAAYSMSPYLEAVHEIARFSLHRLY